MINDVIVQALSPLGIPIAFMEYTGKENAYVVFQTFNHLETDFSDNENESETYYVQVNYWYNDPKDYAKISEIKATLKANGFMFDYSKDLYNNGFYGITLDWIYRQFV